VIANCENLAHGRGINEPAIKEMQMAGVDYFTSGDHVFWQKGTEDVLEKYPIIRPSNYPKETIGNGSAVIDLGAKGRVLLINIMGRTFLNERLNDPFREADEVLKSYEGQNFEAILVDFHAEATSEKMAMGFYLDGRVTAVVGTHTHVPTCDCFPMPKSTLFVSDIGITKIIDSVLGVKKEIIIRQYLSGMNQKFEWEEEGRCVFRSVLIDTDAKTMERRDFFDK
jgi:metallophosphoesterase (TIGR00282 family)